MVAGVALDSKEWQIVQLLYSVNIGGFLLLPFGSGNCDTTCTPITPRAVTTTTACKPERTTMRSIKKTRKLKTDFDWSESEEDKLERAQRIVESGQWQVH
jgi:hypothetical protein